MLLQENEIGGKTAPELAVLLRPAAAQLLGRRIMRRWVRGIVPVVGIGYASWDAQRTVREISSMPI